LRAREIPTLWNMSVDDIKASKRFRYLGEYPYHQILPYSDHMAFYGHKLRLVLEDLKYFPDTVHLFDVIPVQEQ
jgi:hypothetical protein